MKTTLKIFLACFAVSLFMSSCAEEKSTFTGKDRPEDLSAYVKE